MNRLKYLLIGILALVMAGCGQTVVETLHVPEGAGQNAPGNGKSVVILPFADYSFADNLTASYRRNLQISESVTDNLVANGFSTSIQEDVFRYMVEQDLISLVAYEETSSKSMRNELSGEWSSKMKGILRTYISEQEMAGDNKAISAPGTHGLDETTVAQLGRRFNADYIVRGRILEYKTREDPTWEPWKKGFLPFLLQGTSRIAVGVAGSDEYDRYGQMAAGAAYGALIGYQTVWPFDGVYLVRRLQRDLKCHLSGAVPALFWETCPTTAAKLNRRWCRCASGCKRRLQETWSGPTEFGSQYHLSPSMLTSNMMHFSTVQSKKESVS